VKGKNEMMFYASQDTPEANNYDDEDEDEEDEEDYEDDDEAMKLFSRSPTIETFTFHCYCFSTNQIQEFWTEQNKT
jgi:hypothetical protein